MIRPLSRSVRPWQATSSIRHLHGVPRLSSSVRFDGPSRLNAPATSPLYLPIAGPSRFNSTKAGSPETSSNEKPDAKPTPPPILPRPLGVPNPPSATQPTWQEKRDELLDRDKHMEKRKFLIKQATSGYFEDFHKTMKGGYGGKIWMGPRVMIREDKALYFPDMVGKNLLGEEVHTTTICKDHISVVALLSTQVAEEHVKSFTEAVARTYLKRPRFRFVQINLQENMLKSAIVSLSKSAIRKTIPENLHATYIHSSQNMEMLRAPMGFENKHLGFVYLVDENAKIRWAGCGYALEEEQLALMTSTRVLLERLREKTGEVPGPFEGMMTEEELKSP